MKFVDYIVDLLLRWVKPETQFSSNEASWNDQKSIEKLYELGENILKIREMNPKYRLKAFQTFTGGPPKIYGILNVPIVLHRTFLKKFNGYLYMQTSTAFVRCRALDGVVDLDSRQIYEANNGVLFVYIYREPNPTSMYDAGIFAPPRIELAELRTLDQAFGEASESLLSQVETWDSATQLALRNRITELQKIAYQQGRSYNGLPTR